MSRVEVSQSIGPKVVTSLDSVSGGTKESTPFPTETYTVHSYQVILSSLGVGTDLKFKVLATNDADKNYQVIAEYDIHGTAVGGGENTTGIMYSDIWNFKWAKCEITDAGGTWGGAKATVIEKHNP
jgi:hypothetical protein